MNVCAPPIVEQGLEQFLQNHVTVSKAANGQKEVVLRPLAKDAPDFEVAYVKA